MKEETEYFWVRIAVGLVGPMFLWVVLIIVGFFLMIFVEMLGNIFFEYDFIKAFNFFLVDYGGSQLLTKDSIRWLYYITWTVILYTFMVDLKRYILKLYQSIKQLIKSVNIDCKRLFKSETDFR